MKKPFYEILKNAFNIYVNRFRYAYFYGAKGETLTDKRMNDLINAYPNYYERFSEQALEEISLLEHIEVKGLMSIPPICEKNEQIRQFFSQMRQLYIDFSSKIFNNINMNVLSMGMSADFEQAILEGSTLVRVGSALFGERIYR